MTVALVLATDPAADLPYDSGPNAQSLLQRLLGQLVSLNVPDVRVLARPETAALLRKRPEGSGPAVEVVESDSPAGDLRAIARLARGATAPLLVLPGGTVASGELLARLAGPRSDMATAVTAPPPDPGGPDDPGLPPVRRGAGRIVSAGTGFHQVTDPNGVFCGLLRVAPAKRVTLARAAERLAALLETPGAMSGASGVLALLLVGLVRAGVRVTPLPAPPLVCAQVRDTEQVRAAREAVTAVNEDRVRLDAAVKSNDGFFTTFAVSTYSRYIAKLAARIGLTPNMVTSLSMAISVGAAVAFAMGTRTGMVVGAVLYYFAFVFDCVDGQLARYTRRFSTFGAWLDATFDRAKEYTVFAGLAVGSTAAAAGSSVHGGDVWPLAVAAMAAQTGRHMIDFAFGAARRARPATPLPVTPLTSPGDGLAPAGAAAPRRGGVLGLVKRVLARTRSGPAFWAKKMIVLPIGERFAVVSVTAALWNARVTFIVLLAWGAVAAAYTLTGRMLRSLTR
ncbi:CDP-alcohol phosphatidyltransferase [Thermomonospora echinospora]|uniref:CDP-alcohol phosphatidyltransferase n=1 Tax=Thermomonospora echinospora TaxID=1992 RepID=A0A1H6E071_9ACTN|nr:CDP-alcohol phosphatidyltransferase family protein [Thermomonospora echinospora]SEG90861.1 CDP-alcohol phosphatidyltransferase [Thermomonospora echinospora]